MSVVQRDWSRIVREPESSVPVGSLPLAKNAQYSTSILYVIPGAHKRHELKSANLWKKVNNDQYFLPYGNPIRCIDVEQHVLHMHVYTQSNLCAYQMLSPPTPPRADSTFEEGIVDDSGAQGVGPGVPFCSGARWRGRFWFTLGSERDPLVLFLGIPTMFKH